MKFEIIAPLVAKPRPRVTKWGTYIPKNYEDYATLVRNNFRKQCKNKKVLEGPIKINLIFYMLIPKNTSKVKREKMLKGELLPAKRPDFDNLAKGITDALNGLAFKDDNQIVEAHIYKRYGDPQKVEVEIKEV